MLVERGETLAVELGMGQRRLRPLLLGAFGVGAKHVEALVGAVRPLELTIDEDGGIRKLAAWRLRVRRNNAVDDRFHRAGFIEGEELPWSRPHDLSAELWGAQGKRLWMTVARVSDVVLTSQVASETRNARRRMGRSIEPLRQRDQGL